MQVRRKFYLKKNITIAICLLTMMVNSHPVNFNKIIIPNIDDVDFGSMVKI